MFDSDQYGFFLQTSRLFALLRSNTSKEGLDMVLFVSPMAHRSCKGKKPAVPTQPDVFVVAAEGAERLESAEGDVLCWSIPREFFIGFNTEENHLERIRKSSQLFGKDGKI